jgi:hypothetical protein
VDVLIFLNLYLYLYLYTEILLVTHGSIFLDIRDVCYWRTIFITIKKTFIRFHSSLYNDHLHASHET